MTQSREPTYPRFLVETDLHSTDPNVWAEAFAPALSTALKMTERDALAFNLCSDGGDPGGASMRDLAEIRECSYVVVDTTRSSARLLLLVGFAIANRKRVIQVQNIEATVQISIPGVRVRYYENTSMLRAYLGRVIEYLESRQESSEDVEVRDFLIRCGFPLVVLEGDGRYGYALPRDSGERPIYVNLIENSPFVPPEPWIREFNEVLQRQLVRAASAGEVLFNGQLVRLFDYVPLRDERTGTRGIRIDGQLTDYYTFASSNHCWSFVSSEFAERLRSLEAMDPISTRHSRLANPLTVSISMIVSDGVKEWLVIQRRNSEKNFHGKQDFLCAAAGMVSATRDLRSGVVDVYAAACNEIREETGLNVREEQITFLALLRESSFREVGLVGEVLIEGKPEQLIGPRADTFESKGFIVCEASPEAFASFVAKNLPIQRFAPLGIGAILFSLLRRYSHERIEQAFAPIARRASSSS